MTIIVKLLIIKKYTAGAFVGPFFNNTLLYISSFVVSLYVFDEFHVPIFEEEGPGVVMFQDENSTEFSR
jgi:hypothetical protein